MKSSHLAVLVTILSAAFSTTQATADPKPQNAAVPAAQELANLYGGKTQIWKKCQGGVYYGPRWEAQGYCAQHPNSVGVGKWHIDGRGRVCQKMTWYHSKDGALIAKEGEEECISHLQAADGIVWRSWPKDREWWKATNSVSLEKGFKFKSKIRRLRKKLKV
ncbi:DUF995 domain-containing protein [Leisingera sp. ANG-M7]|uniref:DUF995 domain-containing protein n=1 Tax=Leisingera sp. ANG-M7 TaxID=1577902 RepID=UPI00187C41F9|nr:DUF995 domain-containing protein [Leisingera sp. ANG-M7]